LTFCASALPFRVRFRAVRLLPPLNGFQIMLERLAQGSMTAAELGGTLPPDQRARAAMGMVWMMKIGLITISPAEEAKPA
jgi:hypothetical protein